MARKLDWNDVDALDSRSLSKWGAFQSDGIQTVTDLGGHYTDEATFVMTSDGLSFEITYPWRKGEIAITVRERVRLYLSPRRRGFERLFICPRCERRCRCLALIGRGVGCAYCFDIRCPSERESRIARLARRMDETAGALELKDWYEIPKGRPKGMRADRYVALLHRRQHLLAQLCQHFSRRQRIVGNNKMWLHHLTVALGDKRSMQLMSEMAAPSLLRPRTRSAADEIAQ
jgi:hypothetical protein